jgi:NAD-dependent dihydropyrimidine dehydrogenase PreA subunit
MKLKLTYTLENVNTPVLSNTVLKTGVLVNILDANVTLGAGEMIVDVPAEGAKLESVIASLQEQGVTTKRIVAVVEIDREKCTSCGACVSPCPVQAITQEPNWDVHIDLDRCIRCLLCVKACPVRAISYS